MRSAAGRLLGLVAAVRVTKVPRLYYSPLSAVFVFLKELFAWSEHSMIHQLTMLKVVSLYDFAISLEAF